MRKYVSYLRVSTTKQGADGLGVDAQRASVARFVGKENILLSEYVEVESGAKDDRKQLTAAIAEAKAANATLVIAKLDRLSRNAAFIFKLRDTKVDFQCVDMPDATMLTIGIMAVLAQNERDLIASRTKAALAAKKQRGEPLGKPENLTSAGRAKATQRLQHNARTHDNNVKAAHVIGLMRDKGESLQAIAKTLNSLNYKTRRGCAFTACAVQRLVPTR